MNFPILPLIEALKGLEIFNLSLSIFVVTMVGILGVLGLMANATGLYPYDTEGARISLVVLGIAAFVAVVGMVYILTAVAVALVLYVLGYWILWRIFIRNVIVAIMPEKPEEDKEAEAETDLAGHGEGSY